MKITPVFTLKKTFSFKKIKELHIILNTCEGWARMYCPCGCRSPVQLPIAKIERPGVWSWVYKPYFGLTLNPSIKNEPCGYHFLIRNNKIFLA